MVKKLYVLNDGLCIKWPLHETGIQICGLQPEYILSYDLADYLTRLLKDHNSSQVNKISSCNYPKKSTQIYFYDKSIYYFKTYQRRFE